VERGGGPPTSAGAGLRWSASGAASPGALASITPIPYGGGGIDRARSPAPERRLVGRCVAFGA
jgi:hypothetical protein